MGFERNSSDLTNSLMCTTQDGLAVEFSSFYAYENGNCDSGIVEVTVKETGKTYLFYKATLNVCAVGDAEDCNNEVVQGRGEGILPVPSVKLHGIIYSCEPPIQFDQLVVFPANGQTAKDLQSEILSIIGRACI